MESRRKGPQTVAPSVQHSYCNCQGQEGSILYSGDDWRDGKPSVGEGDDWIMHDNPQLVLLIEFKTCVSVNSSEIKLNKLLKTYRMEDQRWQVHTHTTVLTHNILFLATIC